MSTNDTTTGATPGAGATPEQAGPTEPTTQPPTGATPPAGTTATAAATSPATGDESALGDAGKQILAEARRQAKDAEARAKAAEQERDALKAATLTEQEKAIEAARKEAAAEAEGKWQGHVRRSSVRQALTAAGITQGELDLAANAPEFTALAVNETGDVKDLAKAVDDFKKLHPTLFQAPETPPGGQGVRAPVGVAAAAEEALAKGDIRTSIALKTQQLSQAARR